MMKWLKELKRWKELKRVGNGVLMTSFNLSRIKLFIRFWGNIPWTYLNPPFLIEMSRNFIAPICFSVYFLKAFPKGEYANLACSIICLWLEVNISSPVRYSYLSIFRDHPADIFAVSLLISYCGFSSLILPSIVMISFYVLSKIFFLKLKGLSDTRVVSITKQDYFFAVNFL